jgi:hypothetical protein
MSDDIIRSNKIFKVVLAYDDRPGLYSMDAIEHEDKLWLVPSWLEHPSGKYQIPMRIICLETFPHQRTPDTPGIDFALNVPLPRAACEGRHQAPAKPVVVVKEIPDLRYPVPTIH